MLRRHYENQFCTVARTLEVIGERWTILIIRDAFLGVTRFSDFRARLGITASVLTGRLSRLLAAGILEQAPYQVRPARYRYRLTSRGRELAHVVLSLMRWGDRHLTGRDGPPRIALHSDCGGRVEPVLCCDRCAEEVPPEEIAIRPARHGSTPDGELVDRTVT